MKLPPEDLPDVINIGPVLGIPIIDDDDPRFVEERKAWSSATKVAQALHSADELLGGMHNADWRVRHEVVDRLVARASDDARTLPVLIHAATSDPAWQVRDAVVMRLDEFDSQLVLPVLRNASSDEHPEVRWAAAFVLSQLGAGDPPAPM